MLQCLLMLAAGGSIVCWRGSISAEGLIAAGEVYCCWWVIYCCWEVSCHWEGSTVEGAVYYSWLLEGLLLLGVFCCRWSIVAGVGGSIVAGGSIVVGCGGTILILFLLSLTNYIVPQMLLSSVFSKRSSAGRWVGVGTKDWCSEVGRGKDNG